MSGAPAGTTPDIVFGGSTQVLGTASSRAGEPRYHAAGFAGGDHGLVPTPQGPRNIRELMIVLIIVSHCLGRFSDS